MLVQDFKPPNPPNSQPGVWEFQTYGTTTGIGNPKMTAPPGKSGISSLGFGNSQKYNRTLEIGNSKTPTQPRDLGTGNPRLPFIPRFPFPNFLHSHFFWTRSSSLTLPPFLGFSGLVIPEFQQELVELTPSSRCFKRIWENPRKSFGIRSCPSRFSWELGEL